MLSVQTVLAQNLEPGESSVIFLVDEKEESTEDKISCAAVILLNLSIALEDLFLSEFCSESLVRVSVLSGITRNCEPQATGFAFVP